MMMTGVEALISLVSSVITLHPGDILATGTPKGVGAGFTPPRFLTHGDSVSVELEGVGRLVNAVSYVLR